MKPVNVALAGFGWWGKKMAELIRTRSSSLNLIAVADPSTETAHTYFTGTDVRVHATLDELLTPQTEAIILATPHALHEAQIAACVAAGKHVFCEKPLALTRAGAVRAVEACHGAGLVLGMGHERRFEPPIADMINAADSGALGTLLQIEANFSHDKFITLDPSNWRLDASHAPAGGMTATGIHLTDLAIRLMGTPKTVLATAGNLVSQLPAGDTMSAYIRFHGGATAYVSATLATPFVSRFAVFGSKGWIDIRDRAHVEAPDGWVVTTGMTGMPMTTKEIGKAEPVLANLEAFAAAVRGEAAYPITGAQMIDNIALLEAIVASCRSGTLEDVAK